MTALEALYKGELKPAEFEADEFYKSVFEDLQKLEGSLRRTLLAEDNKTFQEYIDVFGKFNAICESRTFVNGFKLAIRILFDSLD